MSRKIYVAYAPGCYGSYVCNSIYQYTELRVEPLVDMKFGEYGSSHSIRQNANLLNLLDPCHDCVADINSVVILPDPSHQLDYFNNQFFKHKQGNLIDFILTSISKQELTVKLKNNWQFDGEIGSVPNWIMREYISNWIDNFFKESYNIKKYKDCLGIKITTEDIYKNFLNTIKLVIDYLSLSLTVADDVITTNHNSFLNKQKFYKSQINCNQWVDVVLNLNIESPSPCQTIFDEAYVQSMLCNKGYDIYCYNLNMFPTNSTEMRKLLQKHNAS